MIFFILNILTEKFHLKLYHKCKFLGSSEDNNYFHAVKEDPDVFNTNINGKNTVISVETKSGNVFDIRMDNYRLIFYPKHGGYNQQFTLKFVTDREKKIVMIEGVGKCMKYIENYNVFEFNLCDKNDDNQLFEYREYLDLQCNSKKIINEKNIINNDFDNRILGNMTKLHVNGMIDTEYPTKLQTRYILTREIPVVEY
ncbi:hypothetical protein DMUE_0688 [Dictyocoela muelleri]|nr:hypothetical protein DMUE_0688 [Dictyocoela muelleri]